MPWTASYRLGIAAVLVLAAFLRLYALDTVPKGLFYDEAMDGNDARLAMETGRFQVFYPANNGREGLYINLAAPLVRVLGSSVAAIRLPAAIFGILTVWMVYLLGGVLFSRRVALMAAFFTATSTWNLHNSRLSSRAVAAPFFLGMAIYLLLRAQERMRGGRRWVPLVVAAGLTYGLGFHTYIAYRATPLLIGGLWLYWFVQSRKGGWLARCGAAAACFTAMTALTIAPLLYYFLLHPGASTERTAQVSALASPNPVATIVRNCWGTAQMFFLSGDPNWRHNISGRREVFLPVALLFAYGVILAMRGLRGKSALPALGCGLLLGWLVVTALPAVLSVDEVHILRTAQMIPGVFLLAALAAVQVFAAVQRRISARAGVVAAAIAVAILCWEPVESYFIEWADNPNVASTFSAWMVDSAREINRLPAATLKFIVVPKVEDAFYEGVPLFLQPVVYLTETYTPAERKKANLEYIVQRRDDPMGAPEFCRLAREQHRGATVLCVAFSNAAPSARP